MSERYVAPGPIDLVGFLCLSSANGVEVSGPELPGLLAEFLSRRGLECISSDAGPLLDMGAFRREGEYLVIGGGEGFSLGLPLDLPGEDPPVLVKEEGGDWEPLAGSLSHFLLAGIDRRVRSCGGWRRSQAYVPGSYYHTCPNLEPRKLLGDLTAPDWPSPEEWEEEEDWYPMTALTIQNVTYPYGEEGRLQLPEGLEDFLKAHTLDLEGDSLALAVDLATMTLYSARYGADGGYESLLQVRPCLSAQIPYQGTEDFPLICRSVDETMDILARKVHDPALAHALALVNGLPQRVQALARKEMRYYSQRAVQLFLERFEEIQPYRLGRQGEEGFIPASGLRNEGELAVLWSRRPQNANPFPWQPALPRVGEDLPAPARLEPFVEEVLYRCRDYLLLNRYTFLARKMVTQGEFSKLTEDYTDEERFALLSVYREMLDGVLECLFTCIQTRELTVRIKGKDLLDLCPDPLSALPGWRRHYCRKELDFLDGEKWVR